MSVWVTIRRVVVTKLTKRLASARQARWVCGDLPRSQRSPHCSSEVWAGNEERDGFGRRSGNRNQRCSGFGHAGGLAAMLVVRRGSSVAC